MKKTKLFFTFLAAAIAVSLHAEQYLLSTDHTSLVLTVSNGNKPVYQYFGTKLSEAEMGTLFNTRSNFSRDTYSTFGLHSSGEKALAVVMPDGTMSLDLTVTNTARTTDKNGQLVVITMKDKVYPFIVKQYYKAYNHSDVFSTWTEITNEGKKDVRLLQFASTEIPLRRGDNYASHVHGSWGCESYLEEQKIPNGQTVLADKEGLRNAWTNNPSVMITADGAPEENEGEVFGCNLLWSGNYKIKIIAENNRLSLMAGINEETSTYNLTPHETFKTPELAMAYSTEGKGGISRAFHRWARQYALRHGDKPRDILLNSWEGVYMNVNQGVMDQMMGDISKLGGELFVMDDGWFGDKYPRDNDNTSLGDWMVNKKKLPEGIEGLLSSAKKYGIKFGIWIEPEMANTKSELFDKHPDWILQQKNRPLIQGRGGTQVVLDLTNPKVQDYVFSITDNLLSKHPDIAYIKWDCNAPIMNYGSTYVPAAKQSEIYIRYHIGLRNVLERIRAKYPDVVIQDCASGGGRVNYGLLPYFDEFWTSDDTDAFQRLFIQWGDSHFYPAIAMASHVSASPNHQTGRIVPLKFRFDVAMTGRLGLELQPKSMTDAEKEFATRAIAAYKEIRPIVQFGDLYRLVSPYSHQSISSLMYATEDKSRAAFFAYRIDYLYNQYVPIVRLAGVDENRSYRIKDLTPNDKGKPCNLDGKVISGKILKYTGLQLSSVLGRPDTSVALELTAE